MDRKTRPLESLGKNNPKFLLLKIDVKSTDLKYDTVREKVN